MDISKHATLQAAAKMANMHDTAGLGRRQTSSMMLVQSGGTIVGGLALHCRVDDLWPRLKMKEVGCKCKAAPRRFGKARAGGGAEETR